jgi:hypothetical protein
MIWLRFIIAFLGIILCSWGLYMIYPHIMSSQEECRMLIKEVWCSDNQTASTEWNKSCTFLVHIFRITPAFILLGFIGIFIAVAWGAIKDYKGGSP